MTLFMATIKFIDLVKTLLINHESGYHDAAIQTTYSKCLNSSIISNFILTIELKGGRSERDPNLKTPYKFSIK